MDINKILQQVSWVILIAFSWEQMIWVNPELTGRMRGYRIVESLAPPSGFDSEPQPPFSNNNDELTEEEVTKPPPAQKKLKDIILESLKNKLHLVFAVQIVFTSIFFLRPPYHGSVLLLQNALAAIITSGVFVFLIPAVIQFSWSRFVVFHYYMPRLKHPNPFSRRSAVVTLGRLGNTRAIPALVPLLLHDEETSVREEVAVALNHLGWNPITDEEKVYYYFFLFSEKPWDNTILDNIINMRPSVVLPPLLTILDQLEDHDEWYRRKIIFLLRTIGDPQAIDPLILIFLTHRSWELRAEVAKILVALGWIASSPAEEAYYYVVTQQWEKAAELGSPAIEPLIKRLEYPDPEPHISRLVVSALIKIGIEALPRLIRILKDEPPEDPVRSLAYEAIRRIQPLFFRANHPVARALLTLYPRWALNPPFPSEFEAASRAIRWLPPVAGTIQLIEGLPSRLPPTLTAEEQVEMILSWRRQEDRNQFYTHQLSVLGSCLDEFKYVALALILSSPYPSDWNKILFTMDRIEVAPLVHNLEEYEEYFEVDDVRELEKLNPLWKEILYGYTSFLGRTAGIQEPNLEYLERHSEWEIQAIARETGDAELAERIKLETSERFYLLLQLRSYQRLALAYNMTQGTTPVIPEILHTKLASHWVNFLLQMQTLLEEYGLQEVSQIPWFLKNPRRRKIGGAQVYRYEADWKPIQQQLIHLQEVVNENPELSKRVIELLGSITQAIDRDIGFPTQIEVDREVPEEESPVGGVILESAL